MPFLWSYKVIKCSVWALRRHFFKNGDSCLQILHGWLHLICQQNQGGQPCISMQEWVSCIQAGAPRFMNPPFLMHPSQLHHERTPLFLAPMVRRTLPPHPTAHTVIYCISILTYILCAAVNISSMNSLNPRNNSTSHFIIIFIIIGHIVISLISEMINLGCRERLRNLPTTLKRQSQDLNPDCAAQSFTHTLLAGWLTIAQASFL